MESPWQALSKARALLANLIYVSTPHRRRRLLHKYGPATLEAIDHAMLDHPEPQGGVECEELRQELRWWLVEVERLKASCRSVEGRAAYANLEVKLKNRLGELQTFL